jgi:serine/threonine-protein kinase
MAGTLGYLAPELAHHAGDLPVAAASPRSDVYSLACIAYELLTGQPVFASPTDDGLIFEHATGEVVRPSKRRAELPQALDVVLLRALNKDPVQRTPSVIALQNELRGVRVSGLEPRRILLADDDDDFCELLGLKLRAEFPYAEVEAVADGAALLAAFDREPASVVIIDLEMPFLDGVAVTVALRGRAASATVPIVVVTASGGAESWKLLAALGADRLLVKPVDLDDLTAVVRRTLKQRSEFPPASTSRDGSVT